MVQTRLRVLALVAAIVALAGCTTKPQAVNTAPPPQPPSQAAPSAPVRTSILPGSIRDFRENVGDTIHFAYNEYNVEDSDKQLLQRQAAWLNRYSSVRVTIEGHCDERGTREYNLALGARRANAVKEYLISLGVASGSIETVSYGKERPICTDSNEGCWAQNRRGVTTITGGAASS